MTPLLCAVSRAAGGRRSPYARSAHPGHVFVYLKGTCGAGVFPASDSKSPRDFTPSPLERLTLIYLMGRRIPLCSESLLLLTGPDGITRAQVSGRWSLHDGHWRAASCHIFRGTEDLWENPCRVASGVSGADSIYLIPRMLDPFKIRGRGLYLDRL